MRVENCSIVNWNSLGYNYNEWKSGIDGIHNGRFSEFRWNEYHGSICTRCGNGFSNAIKYRKCLSLYFNALATFARSYSADNIGAVLEHASSVFGSFRTCHSLNNNFALFIDEDSHLLRRQFCSLCSCPIHGV